jgi:hypothetical protein
MTGHEETARDDERETSRAWCRYGARATSQEWRKDAPGNFLRQGRKQEGRKNQTCRLTCVRVTALLVGIIASVSTLGCERLGRGKDYLVLGARHGRGSPCCGLLAITEKLAHFFDRSTVSASGSALRFLLNNPSSSSATGKPHAAKCVELITR